MWNEAEIKLKAALDRFTKFVGSSWEEKPGGGAFYGPKIDIELMDALHHEHQCGTIQLDFNLPRRFSLRYKERDDLRQPGPDNKVGEEDDLPAGYARLVMIHREIFGSFERMFGVLTEHFGGKWPFWLSARQVLVVPVMPAVNDYAEEVRDLFQSPGLYADADMSGNTLQKKIRRGRWSSTISLVRDAQTGAQMLVMLTRLVVVGAEEQKSRTVNIRNRDDMGTHSKGELVPLDDALDRLVRLRDGRRLVDRI